MDAITLGERDWTAVQAGLTRWLRGHWPERSDLRLAPLSRNESNGFSSESVFLDLAWSEGRRERHAALVARLPPAGGGMFPEYDLEAQGRVQEAVREAGIPAARVLAYEADDGWIGAPFLLMTRVPGRVPSDFPSYAASGWLYDASPDLQRYVGRQFAEVLADIHSLDWQALGLGFVSRAGGIGLAAELDWWVGYAEWAADGSPPQDVVDAAAWCRENLPDPEPPPSLAWGDSRFGNVIVDDDFRLAAVLDWEMVTLCPGELDLGWSLATRARTCVENGIESDAELPGFPGRDETVRLYQQRLGRPVDDPTWYELFAHLRLAGIVLAIIRVLRTKGVGGHQLYEMPALPDWVLRLFEDGGRRASAGSR